MKYVMFVVDKCNKNPRVRNTGLKLKFDSHRVHLVYTFRPGGVNDSEDQFQGIRSCPLYHILNMFGICSRIVFSKFVLGDGQ